LNSENMPGYAASLKAVCGEEDWLRNKLLVY